MALTRSQQSKIELPNRVGVRQAAILTWQWIGRHPFWILHG